MLLITMPKSWTLIKCPCALLPEGLWFSLCRMLPGFVYIQMNAAEFLYKDVHLCKVFV